MDRILITPENRMLESFSGDFSMFGGAVDPAVAVKFTEAEEARDAAQAASAPLSQSASLSAPGVAQGDAAPRLEPGPAEEAAGSASPSPVPPAPEAAARVATNPDVRDAETSPIQSSTLGSAAGAQADDVPAPDPVTPEDVASPAATNSVAAPAAPVLSQTPSPADMASAEPLAPAAASAAALAAPVLEPAQDTLTTLLPAAAAAPAAAADAVSDIVGSVLGAAPLEAVTAPLASIAEATPASQIADDLTDLGGSDPAGGIATLVSMVSAGEILGAEDAGEAATGMADTVVDPVLLALSDDQPSDESDAADDAPADAGINLPLDDDIGGIL